METLLYDRTTNQPRSVHSGRGDKSIAHGDWEAKARSPPPWPWRDGVGAGPSGPFPATASTEGHSLTCPLPPSQGESILCASRMWSI